MGQVYQSYTHPFLENVPALSVRVNSLTEAETAVKLDPAVILFLDVRMSKDQKLFVQEKGLLEPYLNLEKLGPEKYQGDRPYFYAFSFLKIYSPELQEVRTYLQRFPQQRFVLNVQDNALNIHEALAAELQQTKAFVRVLIQSDIDVIIKSLRRDHPTWLFGSSLPEITRVLSLQSVGLEMVPAIRADVWLTPLKFKNRPLFNQSLAEEIRRRFKRLFLGPLHSLEEIRAAQTYLPEGLIFLNLPLFEEFMKNSETP